MNKKILFWGYPLIDILILLIMLIIALNFWLSDYPKSTEFSIHKEEIEKSIRNIIIANVGKYYEKHNAIPDSVDDIEKRLLNYKLPLDPWGQKYIIDKNAYEVYCFHNDQKNMTYTFVNNIIKNDIISHKDQITNCWSNPELLGVLSKNKSYSLSKTIPLNNNAYDYRINYKYEITIEKTINNKTYEIILLNIDQLLSKDNRTDWYGIKIPTN